MQVIMFDLDGTIIDSGPGITKSVQYAFEKLGKPQESLESLRCFVGPPLKEQFMSFGHLTEEEAIAAVGYYREAYRGGNIFDGDIYEGIPELLAYLKEHGCILVLATSKPEEFARQILDHHDLTKYFTHIAGATMTGRTAKADVIEEALKRLHMSGSRQAVLMVGDREYDVAGARACGIQCIGVTYGYGTREELARAGAAYIVDTPEELKMLAPEDEDVEVESRSIDMAQEDTGTVDLKKEETSSVNVDADAVLESVIQELSDTVEEMAEETETFRKEVKKESVIRKLWRIAYPMVLHYGISFAVSGIGDLIIGLVASYVLGITSYNDLYTMLMHGVILLTGIGGLICIPILRYFYHRDIRKRESGLFAYRPHMKPVKNRNIKVGILLSVIALTQLCNDMITYSGLKNMFPSYTEKNAVIYENQSWLVIILVVVIVAPVAEELVFRALIEQRITDYLGSYAGIFLSALMFGIYHGNMVQFVYATLLGIFLGWVMESTGDVRFSMAAHMIANLWSVVGATIMALLTATAAYGGYILDGAMTVVLLLGFLTLYRGRKEEITGRRQKNIDI